MSYYDDASLVLIPSGVKASKVYSQKPTDGTGDLTFSRASTATRTNASGALETVASNVPRLDYMTASGTLATCPMLEVEGQRTNLVFPSDVATTQTLTVTAVAHTLTFYGTGTVVLSGVAIATLTGTGVNDRVALTFTPTAGSLILTVTGTVTNWQLEDGTFSSTLIPTTTAAVTRLRDSVSISGASALIGQTEGTIFIDVDFRVVTGAGFRNYFRFTDATGVSVLINCATSSNGNNCNLNIAGSTQISGGNLTQGRHKIVANYSETAGTVKFFIDGTLRGSSAFTSLGATVDRLNLLSSDTTRHFFGGCNQFAIWKTALTNAQCIEISTL